MKKVLVALAAVTALLAFAYRASGTDPLEFMPIFVCTNPYAEILGPPSGWDFMKSPTGTGWIIRVVGDMADDKKFSDYASSPAFFNAKIWDDKSYPDTDDLKVTRKMSCTSDAPSTNGGPFKCESTTEVKQSDVDLDSTEMNIKMTLYVQKGTDCDETGLYALKLDANNNFVPDYEEPAEVDDSEADTDEETVTDTTDESAAATDEDPDGDGVAASDNCPNSFNPDQADSDGDGVGDVCDTSALPTMGDMPAPSKVSEAGGCSLIRSRDS